MLRKSLAQIGYAFRGDGISFDKALEFHMIAGEIAVLQSEQYDKEKRKSGGKK